MKQQKKKQNKITLIGVFLKKEKIHWRKMKQMFSKFKTTASKIVAFPIITLLVSIGHYCFAIMHFLFEVFLWVFLKDQFKLNLIKLNSVK